MPDGSDGDDTWILLSNMYMKHTVDKPEHAVKYPPPPVVNQPIGKHTTQDFVLKVM